MPTAQAIIEEALQDLGVVSSGEDPTPDELADALVKLNRIIETWQADERAYFSENDETFTITTGTGQYAVGDSTLTISSITRSGTTATATTTTKHSFETGNKATVAGCVQTDYNVTAAVTVVSPYVFTYTVANSPATPATTAATITAVNANFLTGRPVELLGAFFRTTSTGADTPMGVVTERYWNGIAAKATTGAAPLKVLYRPNYPFGQLLMYPIPSAAGVLHAKTRNTLHSFAALSTDQPMPPGYARGLVLALSIDAAPGYGSKVPQETLASITNAFTSLWSVNAKTRKPAQDGKAASAPAAAEQ